MSQLPCLCGSRNGYSGPSQIPKQAFWLGRTQGYPQSWLLINPCLVASECSMLSIGFAMGEISSVWSPLSSSTAEPHSFLELSSVLPVRWSWKRFSIDGRLWFSSLPDWGQTRASKTPYSRVWIRQICAPSSSLDRVHPTLVLQMSRTTGWELHVKNSVGQDPLLIIASSFRLLITVRFQVDGPYTTSPLVPLVGYQCSSYNRVTPNAGGGLLVTWVLFFMGETRGSKDTSLNGAVLAWGRVKAVNVLSLLFPFNAVSLGLWGTGRCFSLNPLF